MIDIFIRTYKKDLVWLKYCLKSIQKYVTGYRRIVICIPYNQKYLLDDWNLTQEKIEGCEIYHDDYLGQQISKLLADAYCGSKYVLFVDSDCVFTDNFDCSSMLNGENPILYKTHYSQVGDAMCWKPITERALNAACEFEYMRRMPLMFRSETIADLRTYMELIHGVTMETYVNSQPLRQFSEFNALGAFAERFYHEQYHFINTDSGVEPLPCKQFWSWGGITDEIKKEIEEVLK